MVNLAITKAYWPRPFTRCHKEEDEDLGLVLLVTTVRCASIKRLSLLCQGFIIMSHLSEEKTGDMPCDGSNLASLSLSLFPCCLSFRSSFPYPSRLT